MDSNENKPNKGQNSNPGGNFGNNPSNPGENNHSSGYQGGFNGILDEKPAESQPKPQPDFSQNSSNSTPNTPENDQNKPNYPISDNGSRNNERKPEIPEENSKNNTIITTIIVIIIVVASIWYFNRGTVSMDQNDNTDTNTSESNVNITVDDTQKEGDVTIIESDTLPNNQENVKIMAYFSQNIGNDCTQVSPLDLEMENKYESPVVNTVISLLRPLSETETAAGWSSSIPAGTQLMNIRLNEGNAIASFNEALNHVSGSCAAQTARAQIEQTLLQFSYINSVIICVGGNCNQDEIMQP